jgi:hypothetical protein
LIVLLVVVSIFGGLSLITLVFGACLGRAASRADRASDDALRAAGISFPSEAEELVGRLGVADQSGPRPISLPGHPGAARPAI